MGNDGTSYTFHAGFGDLNNETIFNFTQLLNWTLKHAICSKRRDLSLKLMIAPIPMFKKIMITRSCNDNYTSLNDLYKNFCNVSGDDCFNTITEGKRYVHDALKQSNDLDKGKAAAYKYGKAIIPDTLLQHFFSSNWTLTRDYYIKRKILSNELGTTAAFQMLINGTALNSEQFFVSSNGYLDSSLFKTSFQISKDDILLDNNHKDVPFRFTRNIQKVFNMELINIITAIIGCSFDAFVSNIDVLEVGLNLYFTESIRNVELDIFKENEDKLLMSAKKLTSLTIMKLNSYAPLMQINTSEHDITSKPIDSNVQTIVDNSIDEMLISKMDLDWMPSL
jgi:hypothetical protein